MNTDKRKFFIVWLQLVIVLSFAFSVQAQGGMSPAPRPAPAEGAFFREEKIQSKLMARQMPYHVIVPLGYYSDANKTKRYPTIYLLHGLTGHFDNWGSKTKIAEYVASYNYIIVMPEGNNGWYTDSATVPNDKYESYIAQELIPEIDKNFRTSADRNHRAVAGLSMGGYGAVKFGLKNPEMFALVGSFSGALGAASLTEREVGTRGTIAESILSVFGKADSETRRQNEIFKLVKEMPADKIKNLPFIYLDCGTEDFLIENNREFAALLFEKKVRHEFRQLPGAHDWKFWDAQIREFLELSENFIK